MRRGMLQFDDINLRYVDFGGTGETAFLLHGLCGTADEWTDTAEWLCSTRHVVAIDQRGHGQSTRRPALVSPQSYVNDAARIIKRLEVTPAVVIGQSMGGRVAFALAAQHPSLVKSVVVVEATPAVDPNNRDYDNISALLNSWPVPFQTRAAARDFFGGATLAANSWAESLEAREDGLWPRFDVDIMLKTIEEFNRVDWWPIWRQVKQPTLILGGEQSTSVHRNDFLLMMASAPQASYVSVQGAGHDVHLEQPAQWRTILSEFLNEP
ncbi:MAG: alpha/beta hydrolase [Candidatus Eremiobacteraeota bacterium]|nr:alpha/beta hydrolase [Candidatus Eremiobacteraeota bacterium]